MPKDPLAALHWVNKHVTRQTLRFFHFHGLLVSDSQFHPGTLFMSLKHNTNTLFNTVLCPTIIYLRGHTWTFSAEQVTEKQTMLAVHCH